MHFWLFKNKLYKCIYNVVPIVYYIIVYVHYTLFNYCTFLNTLLVWYLRADKRNLCYKNGGDLIHFSDI